MKDLVFQTLGNDITLSSEIYGFSSPAPGFGDDPDMPDRIQARNAYLLGLYLGSTKSGSASPLSRGCGSSAPSIKDKSAPGLQETERQRERFFRFGDRSHKDGAGGPRQVLGAWPPGRALHDSGVRETEVS